MPLFQPKHQKLILQCYPAGRGSDKKPNSSELSYLLYYVSTRRVKLEKVGKFLVKKNQADVSRNRTGNIQVTLEILNALIKKCPDDLNVFANDINEILLSVLPTMDLSLCQHAINVFHTLCVYLQGDFTSDVTFTNNFNKLTNSFINFGFNVPKSNGNEWIGIALGASQSIASGRNLIKLRGSSAIDRIIPLSLSHLDFEKMQSKALKKLNSHANESIAETSGKLNSVNEDASSSLVDVDLHTLATVCLKAFYATDNTSQISFVTKILIDYCASVNVSEKNINLLVNAITSWVPVQLRFLILSILMSKLDKDGPEQTQLIYLVAMASLLSSPVNLVGLSILDNIRLILIMQSHLVLSSGSPKLIQGYTNVIRALTTHIYYQDQTLDIVNELLVAARDILKPDNSNYSNPNKFQLLNILLENTKDVMVNSNANSALQTSRIPLEIFSETFELLGFFDPSKVPESAQIQLKYIDLLVTELKIEYSKLTDFRSANHDNLVTDSHNSVVNLFYEQLEKVASLTIEYLNINLSALLQLLEVFIHTFGANSTINCIPFFLQWQLSDITTATPSSIILDNFAYIIAYYNAESIQSKELTHQILSKIQYRKNNNLWLLPLNTPSEEVEASDTLELSKADIEQSSLLVPFMVDYNDTIFHSHYKYPSNSLNGYSSQEQGHYNEADITEDFDQSYQETDHIANGTTTTMNGNGNTNGHFENSQHISLAMLIQNSENHSIRSVPLSARGLLNNSLNQPKVKELRKAISGFSLKQPRFNNVDDSSVSKQRTDVTALLSELELSDDLGGKGNLTFN
ncbi:hypothetical protein WICPIJ_000002 [Wickerhamomyces pijperi]|uniref:Protein EFR3 n=1 Tax=Wickerhamomyces pijperi TaxID=599730 RepID=A0A9P8QDL2_WICPI|nr:hypothetical protein WICPIJ_000002 [Wickerhamomyces pijperi]